MSNYDDQIDALQDNIAALWDKIGDLQSIISNLLDESREVHDYDRFRLYS